MPPLPFPKSSTPGALPSEGEGRRINGYLERDGDSDRVRRSAGLVSVVDTGRVGIRGMLLVGTDRYVVYADGVVRVSAAGAVTALSGSIPGADPVTMARNNRVTNGASTPQIVIARSAGGAYVVEGGAVAVYPDSDLPPTANSVEFMDGYFLFTVPDGRIFASELNSTDINALSFTTAESKSDGLHRGLVWGGLFYAMGASTIEPYQNVGTQPFPLQRSSSVIPVGIMATMAVAGAQEGWDQAPIFAASDGTVRILEGFDTRVISTPSVARFLASAAPGTFDCSVHTVSDHAFWSISSATATWEFDFSNGAWGERRSGASRWRASQSLKFGNDWIVGDVLSGRLLRIDDAVRTELGQPMALTLESGALREFPARFAAPSLFMAFTRCQAAAAISYSVDGGEQWIGPFVRDLDNGAKYPARVNRLGLSTHHGVRVRAVVEAAADFTFSGATLESLVTAAP